MTIAETIGIQTIAKTMKPVGFALLPVVLAVILLCSMTAGTNEQIPPTTKNPKLIAVANLTAPSVELSYPRTPPINEEEIDPASKTATGDSKPETEFDLMPACDSCGD